MHGLISNRMYDPKTNVVFEKSKNMSNGDWWPHPTIWSVNEQRDGGRSGVVGWPQDPIYVSKFRSFSRETPPLNVIDQILLWFEDPNEPINLGSIYFFEPDHTGLFS